MQPEKQAEFMARVDRLKDVAAITFDAQMEELEANAVGLVAMGGYNTFCEIISLDNPAVIVPRTKPPLEQHHRDARAQEHSPGPIWDGGGLPHSAVAHPYQPPLA